VKISIIEAKENLTKYVEMAQRGVEITINVNNVLACVMVGVNQATTERFGLCLGKANIPDDFDPYNQSILEMFYGYKDHWLTCRMILKKL
jgi:antitoxin (DNA-binding transcriptional repressor) of toxin-antitoxin stability system